jgi:hypothetical protein
MNIYVNSVSSLDYHIIDLSVIQNSMIQIGMIFMEQASNSSNFIFHGIVLVGASILAFFL